LILLQEFPSPHYKMPRRHWTREELIVAFNLYCKLPFGQLHRNNPKIVELAHLLGRTPSSVAMKLCNFASFDPTHQVRGIRGLRHAAKSDEAIWNEFNDNWEQLAVESEQALMRLHGAAAEQYPLAESVTAEQTLAELVPPEPGQTEAERVTRVRLRQAIFRQMILASYRNACCVCTVPCEALLVASHIIPWAIRPELRVNPRNGLCLCALHDRAFDRGLLTVNPSFRVQISTRIRDYLPNGVLSRMFMRFQDHRIKLPEKFKPEPSFLEFHVANIFQQ
jgi:putative restriction endonuclease